MLTDNAFDSRSSSWEPQAWKPAARIPTRHAHYWTEFLSLRPQLRRTIQQLTRNQHDTDDLLQETYVRILEWIRKGGTCELRNTASFAARIARNVALDWLKHRKHLWFDYSPAPENEEEPDLHSDVYHVVGAEQDLERLAAIVGLLPARCREAFTLRKIYGRSQKEIADVLDISENTVEQHLTKAARAIGGYQREALGPTNAVSLANPYKPKKSKKAA